MGKKQLDFMKYDDDKAMYSLIYPRAIKGIADVLTYGAKKYAKNNWQKCDDFHRYIDALYRHLEAWRSGEEYDPESNMHHLDHAITNLMFLIYGVQEQDFKPSNGC